MIGLARLAAGFANLIGRMLYRRPSATGNRPTRRSTMKQALFLGAAAVACLSLSACASANTGKLLDNLQGCERHYDGVVSAGIANTGFSGSIKVDCLPAKVQAAEPASPPGGT